MKPDPNSELARRADEIRDAAKTIETFPTDEDLIAAASDCQTLAQLWHKFPAIRDFQALRRLNETLGINLPLIRENRAGVSRPAQAHPKPQKKGAAK